MQVKIGNKIKELRKRDGRKQEDLKHSEILDEGLKTMKPLDEKYTSPLLSEAGFTSVPIVVCRPEFFKSIIGQFPKKIKSRMSKDQKYDGLLTL